MQLVSVPHIKIDRSAMPKDSVVLILSGDCMDRNLWQRTIPELGVEVVKRCIPVREAYLLQERGVSCLSSDDSELVEDLFTLAGGVEIGHGYSVGLRWLHIQCNLMVRDLKKSWEKALLIYSPAGSL